MTDTTDTFDLYDGDSDLPYSRPNSGCECCGPAHVSYSVTAYDGNGEVLEDAPTWDVYITGGDARPDIRLLFNDSRVTEVHVIGDGETVQEWRRTGDYWTAQLQSVLRAVREHAEDLDLEELRTLETLAAELTRATRGDYVES